MSIKSTILALNKKKKYPGTELPPKTFTPTKTTEETKPNTGRTANTGGSGGGVGGAYDKKTGTFTDASGNKYSIAQEFVPFAKDVTLTSGGGGGGGGSSSQQTQQLQSSLSTPTEPAKQSEIKYYNIVSSASPNWNKLKKVRLKDIARQQKEYWLQETIRFGKNPVKELPELFGRTVLNVPKGIKWLSQAEIERLQEEQSKSKTIIQRKQQEGKVPVYQELRLAKLSFQKGVIRAVNDTSTLITLLPKLPSATILFLKNQPINKTKEFLLNLPGKLNIGTKKVIQNIKDNPTEAVSYTFAQYFIFGGKLKGNSIKPTKTIKKFIIKEGKETKTGLFFKWISKDTNPVLIKFKANLETNLKKIGIMLDDTAEKIRLKSKIETPGKPIFKDVGEIKVKGEGKGITKGTTSKGIELTFSPEFQRLTLKQQVKLAGKELNIVTAQAEKLVYAMRRSRTISKPFQNLLLTKKGIKLFNKFSKGGKLTKLELSYLNKEIKRTSKGLLERSLFASPGTKVRTSRLGLNQGNAGLIDLFKGNFSLKRNKPQVIFFRNQRIQKFPKELTTIRNKLFAGKTLTKQEAIDLLNFQLKKAGRFKPIGFVNREAEVTLAPGEIIRRVKRLGSVRISGKKVIITEAEVSKVQSKITKDLMNRLNKGSRLTKEEIRKLNKGLEKESGFKASYSSYSGKRKPYLNLKSKVLSFSIYYQKSKPISYYPRRTPSYISKGGKYLIKKTPVYVPKGGKSPTPYVPGVPRGGYPPTPKAGYPPYYPPRFPTRPPIKKTLRFGSESPSKSKGKGRVGYLVYGKSGGKFLKLNKKPLTKQDALSHGSYAIDRTTAKTFKIVPIIGVKRFGLLQKRERGYYSKAGYKFREYEVKRGKAYALIMKQIEKRRYGIDTKGEKKGLTLARYLKRLKTFKY